MSFALMFLNASFFLPGILPRSWCRYTVPATMTVIQWVADFSERIKQLQQISQGAASGGAKELKVLLIEPPSLQTVVVYPRALTPFFFSSPHPAEHPRVPREPVCSRGLHHCYPPVRGPGQQLVSGGAVPGGQCHHGPGRPAGRLQLWN